MTNCEKRDHFGFCVCRVWLVVLVCIEYNVYSISVSALCWFQYADTSTHYYIKLIFVESNSS